MWWGLEQDPTSSKIRRDDDDDDIIGRDKQNNKRIDNKNENMVYSYISSSSLLSFIIFVVKYDIVKIVLYVSMINYTFDVVEII